MLVLIIVTGPSTTTHRHTTPTCPSLTVWSIITGRCAHQYKTGSPTFWAVTNQHVLDTSLGYYINPLLNVLLGILIYKESLLWPQKLSIAIAILGVAIMTVQLGTLPIVSIVLAVSFSLYGAVKKRLTIHPFSTHRLRSMARHTGGIVVSNGYRTPPRGPLSKT